MVVTESGMVTLSNNLHSKKAQYPIVVTDSGMVTVFTSFLFTPHSSHEHSPSLFQEARDTIAVVPSGMLKCPSALTPAAAAMLPAKVGVASSDKPPLVSVTSTNWISSANSNTSLFTPPKYNIQFGGGERRG